MYRAKSTSKTENKKPAAGAEKHKTKARAQARQVASIQFTAIPEVLILKLVLYVAALFGFK